MAPSRDSALASLIVHRPRRMVPARAAAVLAGLVLLVSVGLFAVGSQGVASAAFTRPFLHQITETASGRFGHPGGVAVDEDDNLWLGDGGSGANVLDEFGPAYTVPPNEFAKALPINVEAAPASVAIERETGDIYLVGNEHEGIKPRVEVFSSAGVLLKQWGQFGGHAHVAVDNSTDALEDPAACSLAGCAVYVSHDETDPEAPNGDGQPAGVEKFNSPDHAVAFTASAPYISGNEILGTPTGPSGCEEAEFHSGELGVVGMTVDSRGDIYVIDGECQHETPAVLEYRSSGEFVRAITGKETPGLLGREAGGWGGGEGSVEPALHGVAFDPANGHGGHVLVSLSVRLTGGVDLDRGAVDEFEAETGAEAGRYVGTITEGPEGSPLGLPTALAVDSHGDVYVVDQQEDLLDVYGAGEILPDLMLAEPSERTRTTAILNGSVQPEGLKMTKCAFQYVTEAGFRANVEAHGGREGEGFVNLEEGGEAQCVGPDAGEVVADHEHQPVRAEVKELVSGTVYRYRLLASTEAPAGGPGASSALAFTAPHPPEVVPDTTAVANLSATSVDLRSQVNPLGADTSYHFEYDTTPYTGPAEHGVSAPVPDASIGAGGPTGSAVLNVVQHIGGLAPGTVYYYRVVAESEIEGHLETVEGEDETFTTMAAPVPGLPDDRAYELLTPPNKGSAEDMFGDDGQGGNAAEGTFATKDRGYPSETGDSFLLQTPASFGPFPGSGRSVYVFDRAATGWTYKSLASPSFGLQAIAQPAFDPEDLSRVAFVDLTGSGGSEAGRRAIGLVGPPGGEYVKLYEGLPTHGGLEDPEQTEVVASRDLSSIVLDSRDHTLCSGAEDQDEGSHALCEYSGGQLKLVNVDSAGHLLSRCGAELGRDTHGVAEGGARDAVSADGSRVFFTAPDPQLQFNPSQPASTEGCWNPSTSEHAPQLYVRSSGVTTEISAPEEGVSDTSCSVSEPVCHPAAYVGASEDGSRVFFLSQAELTKEDEGVHDLELYEWRSEGTVSSAGACAKPAGCLLRVSHGELGAPAAVFAVQAISADGSAVYFTALTKLTSDAPTPGEEFVSNELDLYRYDTATGTTTYVSTVLEVEEPNQQNDWFREFIGHEFAPEPAASWYTTPDGRYLLFPTTRELTGYDTAGCQTVDLPGVVGTEDGHCEELYRYDFDAAEHHEPSIVCVSCNPSGAPPVSNVQSSRSAPEEFPAGGPVRALSDDGSYVFFDTADALVPQDTNGTLDVYEWHDGAVSLISSGTDSQPSFFLGASADGSNVFFGTHANLVPQDTDTAGDLYDARICQPSDPCIKPPAGETAQCEGSACQHPPPALIDPTPTLLAFTGAPSAVGKKSASQIKAEKLAKALKACKRDKSRKKRRTCEKQARKKYGPKAKKATKASRSAKP